VCGRAPEAPRIDGRLDKPFWAGAAWTDAFVDIEGDAKPAPRYLTRAKMLWDDAFLYMGATLEEPHVWGTLEERDSVIFRDNDFEVFLDPDGDNHRYYEIEINALGTVWDLLLIRPYRDGGPAVNAWDIRGLQTAVHVDGTLNDPSNEDGGWSVEMAIPWKVLAECAGRSCPPADGDQWRLNFSRVQWRHSVVDGRYGKVIGLKEDNWVWSPQGAVDMHRPERWGYVQFTTGDASKVVFRPDSSHEARDLLHTCYEAQTAFHDRHGRYAKDAGELGVPHAGAVRFETTAHGFEASATFQDGAQARRAFIRHDSLVWVKEVSR